MSQQKQKKINTHNSMDESQNNLTEFKKADKGGHAHDPIGVKLHHIQIGM